jgi:nucleoside-diphosphate-sugar epimerase
MHKILVAGGAGFIGSHLCKELLDKKNKVTCLDNLLTSDKKNIEELEKNPDFQFVNCDVTKKEELEKVKVDGITHLFHLASPASPNSKSPRSYISFPIETLLVNSIGTYELLEIAKKNNAKFLYASTSEVYGNPTVSPQDENYFGNVNPNGVRSVYDEGKRFGEAMVMAYFRKFKLDTTIVRIFNTYGPFMQADDGRVVSNFINQAIRNNPITIYGNGKQTRSFCYIDDLVNGLCLAMFSESTKGEVINLGNPNEQTITDLADMIKRVVSSSSELVFEELPQDDPVCRKPNIDKAKRLFGWEPKVGIEEGVQKTVEYFRSQS